MNNPNQTHIDKAIQEKEDRKNRILDRKHALNEIIIPAIHGEFGLLSPGDLDKLLGIRKCMASCGNLMLASSLMKVHENGDIRYSPVISCGDPDSCPVCSHSIGIKRGNHIAKGIVDWDGLNHPDIGYVYQTVEVVLTIPRRKTNQFEVMSYQEDLANKELLMRSISRLSKNHKSQMEALGADGHVRIRESTVSKSGGHFHCHLILWLKILKVEAIKDIQDELDFSTRLWSLWNRCVVEAARELKAEDTQGIYSWFPDLGESKESVILQSLLKDFEEVNGRKASNEYATLKAIAHIDSIPEFVKKPFIGKAKRKNGSLKDQIQGGVHAELVLHPHGCGMYPGDKLNPNAVEELSRISAVDKRSRNIGWETAHSAGKVSAEIKRSTDGVREFYDRRWSWQDCLRISRIASSPRLRKIAAEMYLRHLLLWADTRTYQWSCVKDGRNSFLTYLRSLAPQEVEENPVVAIAGEMAKIDFNQLKIIEGEIEYSWKAEYHSKVKDMLDMEQKAMSIVVELNLLRKSAKRMNEGRDPLERHSHMSEHEIRQKIVEEQNKIYVMQTESEKRLGRKKQATFIQKLKIVASSVPIILMSDIGTAKGMLRKLLGRNNKQEVDWEKIDWKNEEYRL